MPLFSRLVMSSLLWSCQCHAKPTGQGSASFWGCPDHLCVSVWDIGLRPEERTLALLIVQACSHSCFSETFSWLLELWGKSAGYRIIAWLFSISLPSLFKKCPIFWIPLSLLRNHLSFLLLFSWRILLYIFFMYFI